MKFISRFCLALVAVTTARAFTTAPAFTTKTKSTTELSAANNNRRDVLIAGIVGIAAAAAPELVEAKAASTFFFDENIENVREPSQMPNDGKIDLNSAFVGEYKQLPGMFPHAAGKIASNGPYSSVKDIYKIPGLTSHDIEMFKKYEREFTANPPGRAFDERINARVST